MGALGRGRTLRTAAPAAPGSSVRRRSRAGAARCCTRRACPAQSYIPRRGALDDVRSFHPGQVRACRGGASDVRSSALRLSVDPAGLQATALLPAAAAASRGAKPARVDSWQVSTRGWQPRLALAPALAVALSLRLRQPRVALALALSLGPAVAVAVAVALALSPCPALAVAVALARTRQRIAGADTSSDGERRGDNQRTLDADGIGDNQRIAGRCAQTHRTDDG